MNNPNKIFGLVALVVGVALLLIGVNATNSVADTVKESLTGRFTEATTWYLLGGLAAAIFGAALLALPGRRGNA